MNTRDKILMSALELFNENGIRNTSLTAIAKSVGITKPAIYNHFSGKESLIASLYEYCRAESDKNKDERISDFLKSVKAESASQILFEIILSYKEFFGTETARLFWNMIMQEQFFEGEAARVVYDETVLMRDMTRKLFGMLSDMDLLGKLTGEELNCLSDSFIFIFRGYDLSTAVFEKNGLELFEASDLKNALEMLIKPYEKRSGTN